MIKFLKRKLKDVNPISALFTLPFLLVLIVLVQITFSNQVTVGDIRANNEVKSIDNYDYQKIESDGALGFTSKYEFVLEDYKSGDSLIFYNIYNFVHIYIDDELVYDFSPKDELSYTRNLGVSFVNLNLEYQDLGKTIRIYATPIYKDLADSKLNLYQGPAGIVYNQVVHQDMLILICCFLMAIIGLIYVIVSLVSLFKMQIVNMSLLYLGLLGVLFGVWKGMDLMIAPIIVDWNPQLMSFLSIAALALLPVPLCFYVYEQSKVYNNNLIKFLVYFVSIMSIVMTLAQVLTPIDLRDALYLVHILLFISALIAIYSGIYGVIKEHSLKKPVFLGSLTVGLGGLFDIIIYRVTGTSDLAIMAFLLFLVFMISEGVRLVSFNGRKANIDELTGLFNKSYTEQYLNMYQKTNLREAVIMFDLNNLKYTNDTFGHEAGDKLIKGFAAALKCMVTNKIMACRIGGDEFIMIVENATTGVIEKLLQEIKLETENISKVKNIDISYASGVAYSLDVNQSLHDLLKIADERMYQNKSEMKKQKYH